ncbi:hypothetical protein KKF61_07165, partial [Patescibacteria group bacterium]|nr:hypothetical protein [Patescibacteria group bacterium]
GEPEANGIRVSPSLLVPDPDNEGRMLQVPNPKWAMFIKDMEEVRGVEMEIDFEPIAIPDSVELSPNSLTALDKFIVVK